MVPRKDFVLKGWGLFPLGTVLFVKFYFLVCQQRKIQLPTPSKIQGGNYGKRKERLESIVSGKIGKVLRLKKSDIEKADKWFDTKGQKTVFICRFIPIVRSLISIPAGMSEMNIWKFLLYTVLGSTIWNTVLVILGRALGESWETVVNIFDKFSDVILVILVIAFIAFIVWWFGFRKNKKVSKKKEDKQLTKEDENK